jgi:hypothetical protein
MKLTRWKPGDKLSAANRDAFQTMLENHMSALPKDLNQIAKAAGVRKSARRTDVAEAFGRGEFTPDTMDAYLKRQRDRRPHWFKDTVTDPAGPVTEEFKGKANNPWSAAGWDVTKQGAAYKADPALAARLAKAAGSAIGATRPAKG